VGLHGNRPNFAMGQNLNQGRSDCESGTQVALSCLGIALVLVLAIWGEWIAEALR
jgi:hypothetical protein